MKLERGLVQVYTGNGKGKTTAALGLCFRAAGRGLRVLVVQFMKGGGPYGEHLSAEKLAPLVKIVPTGRPGWVNRENPDPEDVRLAREALEMGRDAVTSGEYDLVVLDEANGAVSFGLIGVEDLLSVVRAKLPTVELVLTGRNAAPEVVEAADLVTEMKDIKHYYAAGVPSRVGIEK